MYITIKFFKPEGKLSHEETLFPGAPEPVVWDTDKIIERIETVYPQSRPYVFEVIDTMSNLYNCRLIL